MAQSKFSPGDWVFYPPDPTNAYPRYGIVLDEAFVFFIEHPPNIGLCMSIETFPPTMRPMREGGHPVPEEFHGTLESLGMVVTHFRHRYGR